MKKVMMLVSLAICVLLFITPLSSAVKFQSSNKMDATQSCYCHPIFQSIGNNDFSYEKKSTHVIVPGDGEKKFYAVIAGCSEYQDSRNNIPRLGKPFPESTFRYVYDVLLNASNWEKENIVLLLNEQATKQNIIDSLMAMGNIIDGDDVFFFSWNGHGTQVQDSDGDDGDGKDEAICPYDTRKEGDDIANILTDDELDTYFSMIAAEGLFLMFESCMSGGLVDNDAHKNYSMVDVNEDRRVVVMSTPPDKKGQGMFEIGWPMLLLYGIAFSNDSCDVNHNGWISAEEAFTYVDNAYPLLEYDYNKKLLNEVAIPFSTVYVFILYNSILRMLGIHVGMRLVMSTLIAVFAYILYHLIERPLIKFMGLLNKLMDSVNDPNICDDYVGDLDIFEI